MTNADKKTRLRRDEFAAAAEDVAGDLLEQSDYDFVQVFTEEIEDKLGRELTNDEHYQLGSYLMIVCDIPSAAKGASQKSLEEQSARNWAKAIEKLRSRKAIATTYRFFPAVRPWWTISQIDLVNVEYWDGDTPMLSPGVRELAAVPLHLHDDSGKDVTAEILAAVDAAEAAPQPARGILLTALRHQYDLDFAFTEPDGTAVSLPS